MAIHNTTPILAVLLVFSLSVSGLDVAEVPKGRIDIKPGKYSIPGAPKDFKIEIPKGISIGNLDKMDSIDPKIVEQFKIGSGSELEPNGEISCIYFLKKLAMKGLPAFNDCMKDMSMTIGKLKKKLREVLPCLVKCIGMKLEILNEDGTFNTGYTRSFLEANVPKRLMEHIWKIWNECVPFIELLNPQDPTCDSYRPLMSCAIDSAFKVASEALTQCPDIPDVFRKMATSFTSSKSFRQQIGKYVDPKKGA